MKEEIKIKIKNQKGIIQYQKVAGKEHSRMLRNKIRTKCNLEIKVELLEIKNIINDKKEPIYTPSIVIYMQMKRKLMKL